MKSREENFDSIDYINILYLRNQLLELPVSLLQEKYHSEKMYGSFLDTINIMNAFDSAFFLFGDSIFKAEEVISKYRFLYRDFHYNQVSNDIIGSFNHIKSLPKITKNIKKDNYLDYQQEVRYMEFMQEEDFLAALSYDAVSCYKIQTGDLDDVDEGFFLSSINYFISEIPELFEDEVFYGRVENKIEEIAMQRGFQKRLVRQFAQLAQENFQSVKR